MKKPVFLVLAFLSLCLALHAQSSEELDSIVDLTLTMKDLYDVSPDKQQQLLNTGKYIILEGSISAIVIKSGENPVFTLDLVGGEWLENGNIRIYKCRIVLTGSRWVKYFPEEDKKGGPETPALHKHLLAVGMISGYVLAGEEYIPVIDGHYIRIIP